MKNLPILLIAAIILFFVVVAPSFMDKATEKNMVDGQFKTVQERNQKLTELKRAAEKQNPVTKPNSFSAGATLGKDPVNPDGEVAKGRDFLLLQVGNRLNQLRPFKIKIEKMAALNDTDRKNLVAEVSDEIHAFETLKPEISQSLTKDDVRKVADKFKAVWLKSRQSAHRFDELMFAAKETKLVADAKVTSQSLQNRINALKASGKDTKPYEQLLTKYGKKIDLAKQDVEAAQEKMSAAGSATTDDERQKLSQENEQLLASAHNNIRDAYKLVSDEARQEFNRRFK